MTISTIFLLYFGNFSTVWYFFFISLSAALHSKKAESYSYIFHRPLGGALYKT